LQTDVVQLTAQLKDLFYQYERLKASEDPLARRTAEAKQLGDKLVLSETRILELKSVREKLLLDDNQATLPVNEELRLQKLWIALNQLVKSSLIFINTTNDVFFLFYSEISRTIIINV